VVPAFATPLEELVLVVVPSYPLSLSLSLSLSFVSGANKLVVIIQIMSKKGVQRIGVWLGRRRR